MSAGRPQDAERSQRAFLRGLALLLAVYLAHTQAYLFLNDDAFISFRYADNWARAGEPVYNLGERVEGYTNFLWVALLALIARLGGEVPSWGLWLGPCFGLLSAISAAWLARSVAPPPLKRSAPVFCLLLLALSPSFACWSSGGLEVQLFTLLLTLSLPLSLRAWSQDRLPLSTLAAALSALMTMTRPEGLMFMALLGAWRLLWIWREGRRPRRAELIWPLVFCALYLPYWLWRWRYYGHPLPNTYYVKTGAEGLWAPGGRYLLSWLKAEPWLLIGLLPLGLWLKAQLSAPLKTQAPPPRAQERALCGLAPVTLLWLAGLTLHVARVGGDFMAQHRFLVPIMPLCAALVARTLARHSLALSQRLQTNNRALLLGVAVAIGAPLSSLAYLSHQRVMRVGSEQGVDSIGWLKQFVVQCEHIGRWVQRNTSPETRIATTAAGAIAFYAQRPTLDLLGLNDEWIAHHVPARGARPGHTKSAPLSYVMQRDVKLLIYHPVMSAQPPKAHPGYARALKPRGYQWRVFTPPELSPPYWGVWVKSGTALRSPSDAPAEHHPKPQ